MYNKLKKLSLTFILLNVFTVQSLMADMIFYYSAAILPSIVASQQQAHNAPIANHDDTAASNLVPITINVLGNDTIDEGLEVTVLLGGWDNDTNSAVYVDEVVSSEGTWSIEANQSVTFTPSLTYAGGGVHVDYQITDHDGHSSISDIFINYPELLQVLNISVSEADITATTTVNVLGSVTLTGGASVTEILIQNGWDQGNPTYGTHLQVQDGNWTVVNNEIVFIPSSAFGGGSVYKNFQITDSENRVVTRQIEIIYPLYLRAEYDGVNPSVIEPVIVNVLANDTIADGAIVTVRLEQYQEVYTESAEVNEGNWSVDGDNNVTFTPNVNFSGGIVQMWYQLTDDAGHSSKSWINIEYPAFLQAHHDEVASDIIVPINMDVLANDTVAQGATVTLLLEKNENGFTSYEDIVDSYEGTWHVEANQTITFTPKPNFGGGDAWLRYQISDQDGHTSRVDIGIRYAVFVRAVDDRVTSANIQPYTVNVLENDEMGIGVAPTVKLIQYWDQNEPVYTNDNFLDINEGTWTIEANQSITFAPNGNFTGGTEYMGYGLFDQHGHESNTNIEISYPVIIEANHDSVESTEIVAVTIDVFDNDVLQDGATLTSLLIQTGWDNATGSSIYGTSVQNDEGNWTVVNNEVVFTPTNTFAGGNVGINYQITDDLNNSASVYVQIQYPEYLSATPDLADATDVTLPTTVAVLENDVISDEVTLESVWLAKYDHNGGQWTVAIQIETNDGNWTVVANEVVFTPSTDFTGGIVYINYQLRDVEGHITAPYAGTVEIQYPLGPTPVCTSTVISDLSTLYNLAVSTTENDEEYIFANELFTNTTAIPMLNPMYFEVEYEEQGTDYVELRTSKVTLFDSNVTWTYYEQKVKNIDGEKSIESGGDSGDYTLETDGSYLLSMNGEVVFNPKAVQDINLTDLVPMFPHLTLTADDQAQLIVTKSTEERYWWDNGNPVRNNYGELYTSLNDIISANEYNSTIGSYTNVVFYGSNGAGIAFGEGSSGAHSGVLVEMDINNNTLLTDTAGTWSIETIIDYEVLVLKPILCGYEDILYKVGADGFIYRGGQEKVLDEIGAETIFNESLTNKIVANYVENAPADINASTP